MFRWVDIEKIKILKKELIKFKNKDKKIVLDLGCGTGRIAKHLKKFGINVFCCDINELFLKEISNYRIPTVLLDLNYSIPFKEESVSGIIISDVIEHITNDEKLIKECYRILERGGTLIVFTPSHNSYRWKVAEFIHNKLTRSCSGHINPFNDEKLRKMLRDNFTNYRIIKINFGLTLCGIGVK